MFKKLEGKSKDAETVYKAYREHVHTRPQPILGLAVACADRVQAGMNMRGPAGRGGEKLVVRKT